MLDIEGRDIAEILLQIKAIQLNVKNSFTWASGWQAPIYCDNRIILSYPEVRSKVANELTKLIESTFQKPEVVLGVATGAIGIGLMVAEKMGLPFAYVRPESKKHGRKNQVEGVLDRNQKAVVIEDLISTATSSLKAIEAVRCQGAKVLGMVAIFSYNFEIARQKLQKANVYFKTLFDYDNLIKKAIEEGYVSAEESEMLQQWRKTPETWGK